MNTLIERKARVSIKVARTTDDPDLGPTVTSSYVFEQHRMSIRVSQGGGHFGNAKVSIFGVNMDAMNNIARLWLEVLSPSNSDTMDIDVWDGANYVPLFSGVITWSAINASGAPNVALEIEANESMVAMNTVATPYSDPGRVFLRDIVAEVLAPTGLVVEFAESVPELQIQRPYFTGTPMDQASEAMACFPELTWYINLRRFLVRPVNGPLGGDPVKIDKYSGMIGYPTYSTSGITLATLFDARIRPGLALDIQTGFDFVNRTKWIAAVLQHDLQPQTPGGQWITQIAAQSYGSKGDTSGSAT